MDWKKCFTSYQDAFINDLRGLLAIDSTRDDLGLLFVYSLGDMSNICN